MWKSSSPAQEAKAIEKMCFKRRAQAYEGIENNVFAHQLTVPDTKVKAKFYEYTVEGIEETKPSSDERRGDSQVLRRGDSRVYLSQLCQGDTALVERLTAHHKSPLRAIEVLLSDRGIGQAEIKAIIKDLT